MSPRRYRKQIPDCDGWWLWKEGSLFDTPERLLIATGPNHAEVATDESVCRAVGSDYDPDGMPDGFNYWEMTDCKTMGGYWMLDSEFDLKGIN